MKRSRYLSKFVIPCSHKEAQLAALALNLMMSWEAPTKASVFAQDETDSDSVNSFIKHCINIRIEKLFPPDLPVSSIDPTTSQIWHWEFKWSLHPNGLLIESDSPNYFDVFHIIEAVYSYSHFDITTPLAFDLVCIDDTITTRTYEFLDAVWICGDTSNVQISAIEKLAKPTRNMLCHTQFCNAEGYSEEMMKLISFPEPDDAGDILFTALKEVFDLQEESQSFIHDRSNQMLTLKLPDGEQYSLVNYRMLEQHEYDTLNSCSKFSGYGTYSYQTDSPKVA